MNRIEFSDPAVQVSIDRIQQTGTQQYAAWNSQLFSQLCAGPLSQFWQSLHDKAPGFDTARKVFDGYLAVVREAVGTGLVRSLPRYDQREFLPYCLFELLPDQITRYTPANQVALLARLWNLAEGLSREPAWVGHYVASRLHDLTKLSQVEQFLVDVLDPVLAPATPSEWKGPFQLIMLNPRPLDEEFLPGEVTQTAPRVVCVKDRQRKREVGILLQKQGKSSLIGLMSDSTRYSEPGDLPAVKWLADGVEINSRKVTLPFLSVRQSHLLTRSGFLVATAVDSQRLWIIESA